MKNLFVISGLVILALLIAGCTSYTDEPVQTTQDAQTEKTYREDYPELNEDSKASLSEAQWRERLSSQEYDILWRKKTERPFTGDLLKNKEKGTYVTAGCGLEVFHSDQKYTSGTGWPSFWAPLNEENLVFEEDYLLGVKRIEVLSKCGEHLGHVFPDGPEPTGLRYCINSAALDFIPAEETAKEEENA